MKNKYLKIIIFLIIIILLNIPCKIYGQQPPADTSFIGQTANLENTVYHKTFDDEGLLQRLERLEVNVLGQVQQGAIFQRLSSLSQAIASRSNNTIVPDNQTTESPADANKKIPGLIQELPSGTGTENNSALNNQSGTAGPPPPPQKSGKNRKNNNKQPEPPPQFDPNAPSYYDAIMYVNQGRVVRWKNMPVKIYLPEGTNITYRAAYRQAAIRALDIWKVKSNGMIDYVLVEESKKADITVIWQENFPESQNKTGETSTRAGYNVNQAVAGNFIGTTSMFIPGYYGYAASMLGALVGGLGNDRPKIRDVKLRIGTLPAMKLNKTAAQNLIESIASHEFGHAIGISAHSMNINDIMYPELPFNGSLEKTPSSRDINTAIELYKHTPDISD